MTALAEAEAKTDRFPTLGQVSAGNYKKGKYRIHGLTVSIENPRGSIRTAKDGSWRVRMPAAYGYILGTKGADKNHIDCFVGPYFRSPLVYVIDQKDARTGKWDEHKCFLGYSSPQQVKRVYHAAFSDGKGKDRLGHLEEMTVGQFKDWLKHGDTTFPVKHRADGGAVGMADGGTPVTDPDLLQQLNAPQPVTDPATIAALNAPDQSAPEMGTLSAAGHGALAGATLGFGDELRGVYDAGRSAPAWLPGAKMMEGAARLASNYFLNDDPTALAAYKRGRDEERAAQAQAAAQHPIAYGAGELGGAVPAMAMMPETGLVRGTGLAADIGRGAIMGGEYGAASGAGEGTDAGSRVSGAGAGLIGGTIGGMAGPVLAKPLEWAGERFIAPAIRTVRGWMDPEAEAARRLWTALQRDQEMIENGTADGMTFQQWKAHKDAGEPVTLADLGAGNTQSLLRSAANTSPDARSMLEKVINDRFLGQSERVAQTVRDLVPGGANAWQTSEDLVAAYNKGRVPLYQKAYAQGDRSIMTPTIERLMGSPSFTTAMRNAVKSGQDRAITEGYGAFNPGVTIDPGGTIRFNRGPTGVPQFPNLQYWDSVKRELDDMASAAGRSGEKGRASVIGNMANTLRSELDDEVPSYANARGFASQYFGASNALEAGRQLAGKNVTPQVVQQAMAKMKPDERQLFQEGYAADWADRVIGNMKDTADINKAMFNTPNRRQVAEAVFGPAGFNKIQARLTLESIMEGARQAMGGSSTTRQLIEAGLAGGALTGYEGFRSHFDPMAMTRGFVEGAAAPMVLRNVISKEAAAGARNLIGRVDANTARRVAELLTSNDPRLLRQGVDLASRSQRIMDGLKRIAGTVSRYSAVAPGKEAGIHIIPLTQGAVPASAGQEQPQP